MDDQLALIADRSAAPHAAAASATAPSGGAATVHGAAGDLLLALYGRIPLTGLRIDGDQEVVERLLTWAGTD